MQIKFDTLNDISLAAKTFVEEVLPKSHIFAFYGGMGAGKTTFIKAICDKLGVTDVVNSPSFAIINEYRLPEEKGDIYHFDFYRIKEVSEVFDIGYEDYFYSRKGICFLEWPELIEELLPEETIRIKIEVGNNLSRTLTIE